MSQTPICCGCHLESDYGTSVVTGDGSQTNPFTVAQTDSGYDRPLVRVGISTGSTQSIPDNTDTAVSFDTRVVIRTRIKT